jgi:hypothetical protein
VTCASPLTELAIIPVEGKLNADELPRPCHIARSTKSSFPLQLQKPGPPNHLTMHRSIRRSFAILNSASGVTLTHWAGLAPPRRSPWLASRVLAAGVAPYAPSSGGAEAGDSSRAGR